MIKATFEIGSNKHISGVLDTNTGSDEFNCWSTEYFDFDSNENIYGFTDDGKHISLLNCLGNVSTDFGPSDQKMYSSSIYSHVTVLGSEKVLPEQRMFVSISLLLANPLSLFHRIDELGHLEHPSEDVIKALNNDKYTPDFSKPFPPTLAYFNGRSGIFKQDTSLGVISASHNVSIEKVRGESSMKVENKVTITIDFQHSLSLNEALRRAQLVAFFLRFVAGHGLYFDDINLKKEGCDEYGFVIHRNNYEWGGDTQTHYYSSPLIDVKTPDFGRLMKHWFSKVNRERVRYNFYSAYFSDTYSATRLISAANLFDILPSEKGGLKKALSDDEKTRIANLKRTIKSEFSDHHEIKQSLLRSVGLVTRKSLKERVLERVDAITPYINAFKVSQEDLMFLIKHAIDARNYFVHGTPHPKLHENDIFNFQKLFIDTFLFIYAWSELVECGWTNDNIVFYSSHHPLRLLERDIELELLRLKEVIARG